MVLMLMSGFLYGQQDEDRVSLWNGFSQSWGYNHRLNRLGDWVENTKPMPDSCDAVSVHAAASGSGSDVAEYHSYLTLLSSKQVHFKPGEMVFVLEGRENGWLEASAEASYFDPWLGEKDVQYEVVLNGFDMYAVAPAKADKLHDLYLGVDTIWVDSAAHLLHFRMRVRMRLACSSPGCEWFKNIVHYQVKLQYLALAGPGFASQLGQFDRHLAWSRDSLPDSAAVAVSILGQPGFPAAALGIRSLRLSLDQEFHFVDWQSHVRPGQYDAAGGRLHFDLGLHFSQWAKGQHAAYLSRYSSKPKPPAKWAVKRKAGEANFEIEIALLQFSNATTSPLQFEGKINWKTRRRSAPLPTLPAAVHRQLYFMF